MPSVNLNPSILNFRTIVDHEMMMAIFRPYDFKLVSIFKPQNLECQFLILVVNDNDTAQSCHEVSSMFLGDADDLTWCTAFNIKDQRWRCVKTQSFAYECYCMNDIRTQIQRSSCIFCKKRLEEMKHME